MCQRYWCKNWFFLRIVLKLSQCWPQRKEDMMELFVYLGSRWSLKHNVRLLFWYRNWSKLLGIEKPDLKQKYIHGESRWGGRWRLDLLWPGDCRVTRQGLAPLSPYGGLPVPVAHCAQCATTPDMATDPEILLTVEMCCTGLPNRGSMTDTAT